MSTFKQLNINPITSDEKSLSNLQLTLNGAIKGGEYTTVAKITPTTQIIPVEGGTDNDVAIVAIKVLGAGLRRILTVSAVNGGISVTFDGDPGLDHTITWVLFRLT